MMYTLNRVPEVRAVMLVRRPVMEVFEAWADPAVTTRFWFTASSGRLEAGRRVRWEWGMYGVAADVDVIAVEPGRRIVIEWPSLGKSVVEWTFEPRGDEATLVTVVESGFGGEGFDGTGDELVGYALDSNGGFTMVLCALKALLEHGVELNVVADKAPDDNVKS